MLPTPRPSRSDPCCSQWPRALVAHGWRSCRRRGARENEDSGWGAGQGGTAPEGRRRWWHRCRRRCEWRRHGCWRRARDVGHSGPACRLSRPHSIPPRPAAERLPTGAPLAPLLLLLRSGARHLTCRESTRRAVRENKTRQLTEVTVAAMEGPSSWVATAPATVQAPLVGPPLLDEDTRREDGAVSGQLRMPHGQSAGGAAERRTKAGWGTVKGSCCCHSGDAYPAAHGRRGGRCTAATLSSWLWS